MLKVYHSFVFLSPRFSAGGRIEAVNIGEMGNKRDTEYRYFRACGELFPFAFCDLSPESIRRKRKRKRSRRSPECVNTSRPNSGLHTILDTIPRDFNMTNEISIRENVDLSLYTSPNLKDQYTFREAGNLSVYSMTNLKSNFFVNKN